MKTTFLFLVFVLATVESAFAEPFTCLAADRSTKTITTSMIDDNYCDCPINGEDEPSTSACAHTVKRFYCVGDVDEKTIPLTFVRDGICDCCDGTDEVAGKCKDVCADERSKKILKVQAEIQLHLDGEAIKKKYMKQGVQGIKQLDATVKQLKKELKLEEEELQAKIYSNTDRQVLQQMYTQVMQKKQQVQALETLASSPNSFGSKREFFPLLGKCFKKVSNEKQFKGGSFEHVAKDFEFEVCPFTHVIQRDVSEPQSKPTLLGVWQDWLEDHDDVMVYSGGDECWNGPNRVVNIKVECGSEDALVEVRENGKCTYEFVLSTPAACSKKHADKLKKYIKKISPEKEIVHDEL